MAKKSSAKKKATGPPRGLEVQKVSNPESWSLGLGKEEYRGRTALGLDLGTRCGFAYAICRESGWEIQPWHLGYWDLSSGRYEAGNIGFLRLRRFLDIVQPIAIFYEDVKFTPSEAITKFSAMKVLARCSTSSELLSAFRQTMLLWAEDNGAYSTGYPIGVIKRMATGRGNCNKQDMVLACNQKFGTDFTLEDCEMTGADDAADAAFVLSCGLEEFGSQLHQEVGDGVS